MRRTGLIIGLVAALVLIFGAAGVAVMFWANPFQRDAQPEVTPTVTSTPPATVVTGDPRGSVQASIGQRVTAQRLDAAGVTVLAEWRLGVIGAQWFEDGCGPVEDPVVVLDLQFEVRSGQAGVFLSELDVLHNLGAAATRIPASSCGAVEFTDTGLVDAGGVRAGAVAYAMPVVGDSKLVYRPELAPITATWIVPGP